MRSPLHAAAGAAMLLMTFIGTAAEQDTDATRAVGEARGSSATSLYWTDHERGWHFYEPVSQEPESKLEPQPAPVAPLPAQPAPPPPPVLAPQPPVTPEIAEFKDLQRQVEESRMVAIVRPSEENVRRYMELEMRVNQLASRFSEVTQRVAWTTPELDPTQQGRPVNQSAIEVYDRVQLQQRTETIAALTQTHVLMFFYRSDCPYCHTFAPILAEFEQRHGLQVMPISVDGGALPHYPRYRTDNGIARTLQVSQVPALFLAEPRSGTITPLGVGVLSEEQLIQRIAKIGAPGGTDLVPSVTTKVSFGQ